MSKMCTLFNLIITKIVFLKRNCKIGKKPRICFSTKIFVDKVSELTIGCNFEARRYSEIRAFSKGKIIIGNSCFINNNVNIVCNKKIIIGNNVQIGHNVLIIDHDHDYRNNMQNFVSDDIVIGDNVWIGAGAIILKGSHINDNSIVAAGTIVKGYVEENSISYLKREFLSKKWR